MLGYVDVGCFELIGGWFVGVGVGGVEIVIC